LNFLSALSAYQIRPLCRVMMQNTGRIRLKMLIFLYYTIFLEQSQYYIIIYLYFCFLYKMNWSLYSLEHGIAQNHSKNPVWHRQTGFNDSIIFL